MWLEDSFCRLWDKNYEKANTVAHSPSMSFLSNLGAELNSLTVPQIVGVTVLMNAEYRGLA